MEMPNWDRYEGQYWTPKTGESHELFLRFVGEEQRSYDDDKTLKWVMVFDVDRADGENYHPPKKFVTGAASFAGELRPIMERAARNGAATLAVMLKYKDKQYTLVDLRGRTA